MDTFDLINGFIHGNTNREKKKKFFGPLHRRMQRHSSNKPPQKRHTHKKRSHSQLSFFHSVDNEKLSIWADIAHSHFEKILLKLIC